jgi:hypothetical protein
VTDTDLTKTPDAPAFQRVWSPESIRAFLEASAPGPDGRFKVQAGLNAAMAVEAPTLFEEQVTGLLTVLTDHPILGKRVLQLTPGEDGKCYLKIDRDLMELVLFDRLPDGTFFSLPDEDGDDDGDSTTDD